MTIQRFLGWEMNGKNLSPATIFEHKKDLALLERRLCENKLGCKLCCASYDELEELFWSMRKDELKPATLNRRISTLKSYFHYLQKYGYREDNPAELLDHLRDGEKLPKPANLDLVKSYLCNGANDATAMQTKALVSLMATTGLRISEALSIRYEDIEKKQRCIIVTGKGNKQRMVHYDTPTAQHLNAYAATQTNRRGNVFTMDYPAAYTAITNSLRDKNGRGITPHQLRHMFATIAYERGVEIKTIAAMLGHANCETTERYTKVSSATIRTAFERAQQQN